MMGSSIFDVPSAGRSHAQVSQAMGCRGSDPARDGTVGRRRPGAAQAGAQTAIKEITFSDTKLKNGLRVIISEDHAAPVVRHRRQLQRRFARRAEGADRLRPSVRAHDVQGIRERRPWRAPVPDLLERRLDERDDQQGSHALFRDPARQPARSRALPRGRPDAVARDHRAEPGQPAPGGAGGASARRRQPAIRQDVRGPRRARLRQLRLRAFGDRLDGGSRARRRSTTWRRSSRPTTPPTTRCSASSAPSTPRRRSRRCAATSSRFPRSRRPRRGHDRAGSDRGAPHDARGCPGAAAAPRHGLQDPPSSSPDADALQVLGTVLSSGRSSRFYETIVRQKQLAPSVSAFSAESRGPGLFSIVGIVTPGRTVADLEAAIDAEIERVKTGPIEAWEMEKARNNARSQLVGNLGSSLGPRHHARPGCAVLRQSRPAQHDGGADREGDGRRRAARRPPVSGEDRAHRRDHRAQGAPPAKGGL